MKAERLGLTMVAATLAVIVALAWLVLQRQSAERAALLHAQGASMARVLAGLDFDQLAPGSGRQNLLHTLLRAQTRLDFAYGALVDPRGVPVTAVTAPGVALPPLAPPAEPSAWFGEQVFEAPADGRRFREFTGPVLADGHLRGFVRLGYFEPEAELPAGSTPFLAALALPVFLLTPLAYFLIRRETRPLAALTRDLEERLRDRDAAAMPRTAPDLRQFAERIAGFLASADARIRDLEEDRTRTVASSRLVEYRKDRIESVLRAVPDGIMVLDDSGVATFANPKVGPLAGVDSEQVLGKAPTEWRLEPEVTAFLLRFQSHAARSPSGASLDFAPGGGQERRIRLTAYPLFAPRDPERFLGTLLVWRDTTDELVAATTRDTFVAQVAHDLKTPLATIAMYSELLLDERPLPAAERVEAINAIHDECERMSALIGNLLNISRIESGRAVLDRERVRLADLLRDAVENVSRSARAQGLSFTVDLPTDLSAVSGDKDLLKIAVTNLLGNAVKYNRTGGEVTVSAEENEREILIRVSDTGIGIAPQDQSRIFEKFYRSAEPEVAGRGGHGLGLYLVKQIVDLHQGEISVRSEPGRGTHFTIALTRAPVMLREAA